MIKIFYKDRKQRHFRGKRTRVNGKRIIHPHYIVGEDKDNFASLGITHDESKGKKHKNYLLSKNPEYGQSSKSYMRKEIENSSKRNYTLYKFTNYKMSSKDDDYVDKLVEKKKKYKSKK